MQMLYVGTLRGFDSTGVFNFDFRHERNCIKKPLPATDFLGLKRVNDLINQHSRGLLGHNRAATRGKVNADNAHPFEFDNIMGMHNGTLTERWKLDDYKDFDVDSENLFYHLQKHGLQDTLNKCKGAYALVWHDSNDSTVNLYRNKERPLAYAYSKDRKTLYWASEEDMLIWILDRNYVQHQGVQLLAPDTLMTVEVGNTNSLLQTTIKKISPVIPPTLIQVAPKKDLTSSGGSSTSDEENDNIEATYSIGEKVEFKLTDFRLNEHKQKYASGKTEDGLYANVRVYMQGRTCIEPLVNGGNILIGTVSRNAASNFLTISPYSVLESTSEDLWYMGYEGEKLTYKAYKTLLDKGCSWCSDPADVNDDDLLWLSSTEHLCGACQYEEDIQHYIKYR